jgi:hypothetical protein
MTDSLTGIINNACPDMITWMIQIKPRFVPSDYAVKNILSSKRRMLNSSCASSTCLFFRSDVNKCGIHFKKRGRSFNDSVNRRYIVLCETPTSLEIEWIIMNGLSRSTHNISVSRLPMGDWRSAPGGRLGRLSAVGGCLGRAWSTMSTHTHLNSLAQK